MHCIKCGKKTKGIWIDRTVMGICEQCNRRGVLPDRPSQTRTVRASPQALVADRASQSPVVKNGH